MKILASKGNYHLCEYDVDLFTVDKITKSIGMSLFASSNMSEAENYFNNEIKTRKKKEVK